MKIILILLTCLLVVNSAHSRRKTPHYGSLMTLDYDEMRSLVLKKIQKAKQASMSKTLDSSEAEHEALESLRAAMVIILSRPNKGNMVAKLAPDVRRELTNFNAYEDTLASIAYEAIRGVNNKKIMVTSRGTYLFVLENLMAEILPSVDKPEFEKIFRKIRDAKIKVSKEVNTDRKMRAMFPKFDPSQTAKKVLEKLKKRRAKKRSKPENDDLD